MTTNPVTSPPAVEGVDPEALEKRYANSCTLQDGNACFYEATARIRELEAELARVRLSEKTWRDNYCGVATPSPASVSETERLREALEMIRDIAANATNDMQGLRAVLRHATAALQEPRT